jgi:hypothetical protein
LAIRPIGHSPAVNTTLPRHRRRASAAVILGILLAASGCVVPATPSEHGWRVHAERSVGDVAGALSTTELVLRAQRDGKLLPNYGRVTVAQAEEAAGAASSALAAEQPPAGLVDRYGTLTDAMEKATGLIADARIALVADDPEACATYCADLRRMADELQRLEDRL